MNSGILTIGAIQELCKSGSLRWTNHVVARLLQRGIAMDDVVHALTHGEIIEQYPKDYPFPSCLVLGLSFAGIYLHVVCGSGENLLWIITAYIPSPFKWAEDLKTRKERL
jgi:hypothetical protein